MVSARVGLGLRELPPTKGYTTATLSLWRPGSTYTRIVESPGDGNGRIERIRLRQERDDWQQLRALQILMMDNTTVIVDIKDNPPTGTEQ